VYSKQILEHFRNPRNVGKVENADGFGEAGGGPHCPEDLACFWIRVADGRIAEVKHKTLGCPVAIAASSMTSVMAQGETLTEALQIHARDGGAGTGWHPGAESGFHRWPRGLAPGHCRLLGKEKINMLSECSSA